MVGCFSISQETFSLYSVEQWFAVLLIYQHFWRTEGTDGIFKAGYLCGLPHLSWSTSILPVAQAQNLGVIPDSSVFLVTHIWSNCKSYLPLPFKSPSKFLCASFCFIYGIRNGCLRDALEQTFKEKVNLMVLKLLQGRDRHEKVLVNFMKSVKH